MRSIVAFIAVLATALVFEGCWWPMGCNDMYMPSGLTLKLQVPEGVELQYASGRIVAGGRELEFQCPSADVVIREGTCSLGETTLFIHLDLSAKPRTVKLNVAFDDGAVTFDGSVQPRYDVSEPNGDGCGYVTRGDATIAPVPAA